MKQTTLAELRTARAAKEPVALLTWLASGEQTLFYPGREAPAALDEVSVRNARQALAEDRSRSLDTPAGRLFIQVFNPPLRMLIVGAVHIAQALAPMAVLTGYRVTVIDPRRAFASDNRFPDVEISGEWPDQALRRMAPDHRSAVVTLSHDPKLDDPALSVALQSEAFYIGSLGSRRTHAGRLQRLTEAGFSPTELARIQAPLGLDLGALSPAEIAVSALAQITYALRRGAGR